MKKIHSAFVFAILGTLLFAGSAFAYANSVTYGGQGLIADDFGGYDLQTELCGVDNGADVDGPYILWVLTASKAKNADITGPWGTATMTKFGNGTFKYISGWYDPSTLSGNVTATYDGAAKNAQLTVSHGCRPYSHGAWCSPGFWHNATDAAWALTGYLKSDLFNGNVYPTFFGAALSPDPSLYTVVNDAKTYSGPPTPVLDSEGNVIYSLNAFNATGAFLTDNIPGFDFDPAFMAFDDSETCPIDHFGNWKTPTP